MNVVQCDPKIRETAALPQDDSALPPVLAVQETHSPYLSFGWMNADYVCGARVLQAVSVRAETVATFRPGRHELMTLNVDFSMTREQMSERMRAILEQVRLREQEKIVVAGPLQARFDAGKIVLTYRGQPISAFLHFYASMLISNLWNDSVNLQWHPHEREGSLLRVRGESRRFPYTQIWELSPAEGAVRIRILIEVRDAMDVTEYHASAVLRPEYTRWETPHESGPYPEFEKGQEDWRHANRAYAVGAYAKAMGDALPAVTLSVATEEPAFHMTAINTGYHENARVLQALRTPDAGQLHFDRGTYLYFDGLVSVTA